MLIELNWLIGVNTVTGKPHNVGEVAAFDNALSEKQMKILYDVTKDRYIPKPNPK